MSDDSNEFRQFLIDEMKRRDMSIRQLAEFMDVAPSTISRILNEMEPTKPGLDFLLKISKATGLSLTALIEMAYPQVAKATHLSPQAQIIAQQIETLPDDTREVVLSIIRGSKPA